MRATRDASKAWWRVRLFTTVLYVGSWENATARRTTIAVSGVGRRGIVLGDLAWNMGRH